MARGRKPTLSLDEQLEKITIEIKNMENALAEMKQAKKTLEEQIRQARLSEIDNIIKEKGLTFEDVIRILQNKKLEE